jgi:YVTN family beta-propeller protein
MNRTRAHFPLWIRKVFVPLLAFLCLIILMPLIAAQSAYVANFGADTVSVIDTSSNSVVGSPITVGPRPTAVALTPDGKHLYVANSNIGNAGQGSMSVVDTSTNAVVAGIPNIGTEPIGVTVSPDGTRAWVACSGQTPAGASGGISIIDASTNTVIDTISSGVSNPVAIVFSLDGTRAFVTDFGLDQVLVFDSSTNNLLQAIPSPSAAPVLGSALTPDGARLYVANTRANSVFSIDTATFLVSTPIAVGTGPGYIAISQDGSLAYVVNEVPNLSSNGSLSVISTASNNVSAIIPLGLGPIMPAITPDGSKVFVSNIGEDSISVINTSTNTVTATITAAGILSAPYGIVIPQPAARKTPAQMIASLISTVQGMMIPRLGNSLTNQLLQVETDINTQNGLACGDLIAFAHHVRSQTGKSITTAQANRLLAAVASIESALNCGP